MKTKKINHSPDKKKITGRSFKKNIAVAAVAASLGISLGVPVQDVLAGDKPVTIKVEKDISSEPGKLESNQGKIRSNQVKIESKQGKFKSNQTKIESNQGKFKADQHKLESDQIKGEVAEENVQK